ncbi:hypothetical protein Pmgp_02795 [Pelotomaculum propionicicum]|uniref:Uncharacterized protein n=1 Tax=Pelotomaculum propionicicum TaxID=258475 RepID=A0A4Y7RLL8_9FIRM|nr:hypothetical protein Pmgp_02795 [Pelotomaculum propionicicum]
MASGNKGGVMKSAQASDSERGLPSLRVLKKTQMVALIEIIRYRIRIILDTVLDRILPPLH